MLEFFLLIIVLALLFEIMDSAAGMGFGTSLTPLLFLIGYSPLQVVPAILISESITGFIDSYFDNELKNVNFSFKPMSDAMRLALIIAVFGCISIFISIILAFFTIKFETAFIKLYVAILVILMGVMGLMKLKVSSLQISHAKPKMLFFFATLAGFNKGIGGGGYGPVITMGGIFSGIYEKSATAIVSLSEAIVSVTGALTFFLISSAGIPVDLILLPSILTGAFFGALITPYIVRVLPNRAWQYIIPLYAFSIGIYTLLKLFLVL